MKNITTTNVHGKLAGRSGSRPVLIHAQGHGADRLPLPEVTYVDWAEWERVSILARMGIDLGVSRQTAR